MSSTSKSSPRVLAAVVALLALIGGGAAAWTMSHGYTLDYNDGEAHLDIARRIVDSRTPGPEQLGTTWLPLPHLLMIPFVLRDSWWRSGAAGAIPSVACFVLAGAFLFAAARRVYASAAVGLAVALLFALNPNVLYLQSTPMTEPLLLASLAGLVWATLWFRDSQSVAAILAAAIASNAASLTRYEGWFLIPFVSLYLLAVAKKKWMAVLFGALAALGPLSWLAHNRFYYGNPLEFYNGPWSALGVYESQIKQGVPYPSAHNWPAAIHYYSAAARLVAGGPVLVIGLAGTIAAFWKRAWWPLFLIALVPVFYIWSMHSAGTNLYVPDLFPHEWFNLRYAIVALPLAALGGGALVTLAPRRWQWSCALAIAAIPAITWITEGSPAAIWTEADRISNARLDWTRQAARFLESNYQPGSGIMFPSDFGSMAAVLREAGIPLKEALHSGNGPAWSAAVDRPDLFLHEEWALTFDGDSFAHALALAPHYKLQKRIIVKGAPVVEIYQRQ